MIQTIIYQFSGYTSNKWSDTLNYYYLGIKYVDFVSVSKFDITRKIITKEITAKVNSVKKSIHGPNKPIKTPIGIAKAPYPIVADIIKLAVLCLESLYPNYKGNVKNNANKELRKAPFIKEPIYAANHSWEVNAAIKFIIQPRTIPVIKTFNLVDTFEPTYSKIILNTVLVVQKTILAYVASWASAIPSITA